METGMEMGMGMGTGRFGAAFLVRVGQLETQLYDACLGPDEDQDQDRDEAHGAAAAEKKQANLKGKENAGDEDAGNEGM